MINQLINGDFEQDLTVGWTNSGAVTRRPIGSNSYSLFDNAVAAGPSSGSNSLLTQDVLITGSTYHFSGWFGNHVEDTDKASGWLRFLDEFGVELPSSAIEINTGTQTGQILNYVEVTGTFDPAAVTARVEVEFDKGTGGTANNSWADEIWLVFNPDDSDKWSTVNNAKTLTRLPFIEDDAVYDRAPNPVTWQLNANAAVDVGVSPYATGNSLRLTGGDDWFRTNELPRLDGENGSAHTILFWAKLDTLAASQGIISLGNLGESDNSVSISIDETPELRMLVRNNLRAPSTQNNEVNKKVSLSGVLSADTWHFFELTRTSTKLILYVDGVVVMTAIIGDAFVGNSVFGTQHAPTLYLGSATVGSSPATMVGNIADVWVLGDDYALSRYQYTPPTTVMQTVSPEITTQPSDVHAINGTPISFSVVASGTGTLLYQWYEDDVLLVGAEAATLALTADVADSGKRYYVAVTDDLGTVNSYAARLAVVYGDITDNIPRESLCWNFEDDNFTWFDASHENDGSLDAVQCMRYQFDPGWVVRWEDLLDSGDSWADLTETWRDFYSGGTEENMYWLTNNNLCLSDQQVVTDGMKNYFVERQQMDFSEQGFSSSQWTYAKQMYFHLQSHLINHGDANNFVMEIGWADSMMDEPDYNPPTTINLQDRANDGRVKWDFRSTGRYLAIRMTFNQTEEIQMVGAEMDISQSYGR